MAHVILLHGLWMNTPSMGLLARRLRAAGHQVDVLGYNTLLRERLPIAERLARRLRADPTAHIVAHSLGGLIAVDTVVRMGLPHGRIVCLGSPLAGSATALALARFGRLPQQAMARHFALLTGGVGPLGPDHQVALVAGTKAMGLGKLVNRFNEPSDGTVSVRETRVPGLCAHVEIPCSHTGLVYSRQAADLVLRYLDTGHFNAGE